MIPVLGLRYVRLGTRDLARATDFATRILGLQEIGRLGAAEGSRSVFFRSDNRHHTLVYFEGEPATQAIGLEIGDAAALRAEARRLASQGGAIHLGGRDDCAIRNVAALAVTRDPSGNVIELVTPARDTDGVYVPPRMAGIAGLSHVGLRSLNPARDEAFWTSVFGARVSDRIGTAPMMRFDDQHHQIALLPAKRPGIQRVAFRVESINEVMKAWYFLRENGVRIVFGPGREPTSTAIFLYFEGPDGMLFEFYTGAKTIAADSQRARQYPLAARSFCMWGGKPDMADFNL
ncbi:MAG: VOC family protein [Burkholderiales bacterium]|nr:VOC family protein [Burkholderiales bacterium]